MSIKFLAARPPMRSFFKLTKVAEMEKNLAVMNMKFQLTDEFNAKLKSLNEQQPKVAPKMAQTIEPLPQIKFKPSLLLDREQKNGVKKTTLTDFSFRLKLKNTLTKLLKLKKVQSIERAVYCILENHYPYETQFGGPQIGINIAYKEDPKLQEAYREICEKLDCPHCPDVPSKIYQSLEKLNLPPKYPLHCDISDPSLTPTQWAFVLAMLDTYLSVTAFNAFDKQKVPFVP